MDSELLRQSRTSFAKGPTSIHATGVQGGSTLLDFAAARPVQRHFVSFRAERPRCLACGAAVNGIGEWLRSACSG